MRNILVIEGRQSIGGGQIITKKVCDGLSEENNISLIPQHYYKIFFLST